MLHQPEAQQAVVDGEVRPFQHDHVDGHAPLQPVHQALDQHLGVAVIIEGSVDHVDAQDTDGLLLQLVVIVQHPDVQEQVVVVPRRGVELEAQPQPPVAADGARVVNGGDGIGEDEEGRVRPVVPQALHQQVVFVAHHFVDAAFADVAAAGFRPVDLVRVHLVVGAHRLGDRPGGGPDLEKIARDFLARADLGEGPVDLRVEVDLEGFLVGFQELAHRGRFVVGGNFGRGRGCRRN